MRALRSQRRDDRVAVMSMLHNEHLTLALTSSLN